MTSPIRPRLIGIDVMPFQADGQQLLRIASRDRLSDACLPIRREAGVLLQYMNGKHDAMEIRAAVRRDYGFEFAGELVEQLIELLDEIFVLETPRYRRRKSEVENAFRAATVREPAHAGGAYDADPTRLRQQIQGLFEHPSGPGAPGPCTADQSLRAIFAPHIDFRRGGPTFAWAFKELAEQSKATVFVLIGTSHYSAERFILTRKDFQTPLGVAANNRAYVDRLAAAYGADPFADELAHKPEHSLEFHVLFLQYLFNERRPYSIVPVLVGSFQDAIEEQSEPNSMADIQRMVDALQQAEAACDEEVCYVVSGDLAHVGMKFGDAWQVDQARGEWCRQRDSGLLESFSTGRAEQLSAFIAGERDKRRICGFPPGYTMLDAARPAAGKVLRYDQFVDPGGFEIVSFASLAFYGRR